MSRNHRSRNFSLETHNAGPHAQDNVKQMAANAANKAKEAASNVNLANVASQAREGKKRSRVPLGTAERTPAPVCRCFMQRFACTCRFARGGR